MLVAQDTHQHKPFNMSVVKTVKSGDPISAMWANSIVSAVNTLPSFASNTRGYFGKGHRPISYHDSSAFEIHFCDSGQFFLNTGQLYIDNQLLTCGDNSYNQYGSVENWKELSVYTPQSVDDLPLWSINIYQCIEPDEHHPLFRAILKVQSATTLIPPVDTPPDKYVLVKTIPLNTVDKQNKSIKQLVSGSIYISTSGGNVVTNNISLVAGDGIKLTFTTDPDACKIEQNLSVISTDDIILVSQTANPDNVHTIRLSVNSDILRDTISQIISDHLSVIKGDTISLIAGDGIEFSEVDGDGIVIQLANRESTINIDGIISYQGNFRTFDTIDTGTMGVDLTQFIVGSNYYMLRMEIERTDKGNFLKFSI